MHKLVPKFLCIIPVDLHDLMWYSIITKRKEGIKPMAGIELMINTINAFDCAGIKKLFADELLFAHKLKYSGDASWFEYLFEAYLDCKAMALAMA